MKKSKNYEEPLVEIINVEVEKGFATSAINGGIDGFGNGNTGGWNTNQFEGLLKDLQNDINELGKYF